MGAPSLSDVAVVALLFPRAQAQVASLLLQASLHLVLFYASAHHRSPSGLLYVRGGDDGGVASSFGLGGETARRGQRRALHEEGGGRRHCVCLSVLRLALQDDNLCSTRSGLVLHDFT